MGDFDDITNPIVKIVSSGFNLNIYLGETNGADKWYRINGNLSSKAIENTSATCISVKNAILAKYPKPADVNTINAIGGQSLSEDDANAAPDLSL